MLNLGRVCKLAAPNFNIELIMLPNPIANPIEIPLLNVAQPDGNDAPAPVQPSTLTRLARSTCGRFIGSTTVKHLASVLIGVGIAGSVVGGTGLILVFVGVALFALSTILSTAALEDRTDLSILKHFTFSLLVGLLGTATGAFPILAPTIGINPYLVGFFLGLPAIPIMVTDLSNAVDRYNLDLGLDLDDEEQGLGNGNQVLPDNLDLGPDFGGEEQGLGNENVDQAPPNVGLGRYDGAPHAAYREPIRQKLCEAFPEGRDSIIVPAGEKDNEVNPQFNLDGGIDYATAATPAKRNSDWIALQRGPGEKVYDLIERETLIKIVNITGKEPMSQAPIAQCRVIQGEELFNYLCAHADLTPVSETNS
jgi:hypothetical protein